MPEIVPQMIAGGDIYPSRFVQVSNTDFTVVQAGNNGASLIGISQEGTRYPPLDDYGPPTVAAKAGDQVRVFGESAVCLVEAGATITAGQLLYSDASGKAVPVPSSGTTVYNYGAIALQGGASGQKIMVQVRFGTVRPTLT
ncbi:MAG: capsid cement protein [Kiritimatiellia bacterium]